jgi:hypothetical protein
VSLAPSSSTSDAYVGRRADENGMKAKTRAKPLKSPLDLSKSPVHFAPTGLIVPVVQGGRAHAGVEGRLAGEARMTKNRPMPEECLRTATTYPSLPIATGASPNTCMNS